MGQMLDNVCPWGGELEWLEQVLFGLCLQGLVGCRGQMLDTVCSLGGELEWLEA